MILIFFKLFFLWLLRFGKFLTYVYFDKVIYYYRRAWLLFDGWGIHLFVGAFGKGKTMLMCITAYLICLKKRQVTILTNLKLTNFPSHTRILNLRTAQDILNAPKNCIVLIDEIGTIFNSRDFSGGKSAVPKPLFQLLCQCRKRRLMVFGTVQRYNLLDKQIRDITATVTECSVQFEHPFSRAVTGRKYDIEDYEYYQQNRATARLPVPLDVSLHIQSQLYRNLYDTSDLIAGFLNKEFLSDDDIIRNQAYDLYTASDTTVQIGKRFSRNKLKRHKRK